MKKQKETSVLEDKETKTTLKEKSKLNIFFLILTLLILILSAINFYWHFDFKNFEQIEFIKTTSIYIISLIMIIILFKFNTKKTIPYVIFLSIILITYFIFSTSSAKNVDVYVKDFTNKDITEVFEWASKNQVEVNQLYEFSDTIKKNHVITQDYGSTFLIKDIQTLTVTISDGPNYDKEVTVANLTGLKFDEVMKYIKDNFLNNVEIDFQQSEQEKDILIEQIGSGTMKRNDSIKFIFSSGNEIEEIAVKNLKGLSYLEATAYLKRYQIPYEISYQFDNTIEKNYVISQNIVDEVVKEKLLLVLSKGKEITVPDLQKMKTEEITKWAMDNHIKIKYDEIYDKNYDLGKIIRVDQEANSKIAEDTTITITISKGSLVMPKINDLTEFKLWAVKNNIQYQEDYEFSNEFKNGELIKSSFQEGEKITENDTIILTISKGKSIQVPNFVGSSKDTIQTKCKSLNLSCTFSYGPYTESTKRDIATYQSKASGSIVAEGVNVTITLSSGIIEKVDIPSFIGKTKNQISSTCSSLGINCQFSYQNTYSNTNKDTAVSQDKTGRQNKGSTVYITLSIGPAKSYTIVIDPSLLSAGNPEQTKNTLKSKLEKACPGVNFEFSFKSVNTGIGYLSETSPVHVGSNTFIQGKTYQVIINSN